MLIEQKQRKLTKKQNQNDAKYEGSQPSKEKTVQRLKK